MAETKAKRQLTSRASRANKAARTITTNNNNNYSNDKNNTAWQASAVKKTHNKKKKMREDTQKMRHHCFERAPKTMQHNIYVHEGTAESRCP